MSSEPKPPDTQSEIASAMLLAMGIPSDHPQFEVYRQYFLSGNFTKKVVRLPLPNALMTHFVVSQADVLVKQAVEEAKKEWEREHTGKIAELKQQVDNLAEEVKTERLLKEAAEKAVSAMEKTALKAVVTAQDTAARVISENDSVLKQQTESINLLRQELFNNFFKYKKIVKAAARRWAGKKERQLTAAHEQRLTEEVSVFWEIIIGLYRQILRLEATIGGQYLALETFRNTLKVEMNFPQLEEIFKLLKSLGGTVRSTQKLLLKQSKEQAPPSTELLENVQNLEKILEAFMNGDTNRWTTVLEGVNHLTEGQERLESTLTEVRVSQSSVTETLQALSRQPEQPPALKSMLQDMERVLYGMALLKDQALSALQRTELEEGELKNLATQIQDYLERSKPNPETEGLLRNLLIQVEEMGVQIARLATPMEETQNEGDVVPSSLSRVAKVLDPILENPGFKDNVTAQRDASTLIVMRPRTEEKTH